MVVRGGNASLAENVLKVTGHPLQICFLLTLDTLVSSPL